MEGKRIPELISSPGLLPNGLIAIYDPETDKTYKITVQEAIGAVRASFDWQTDNEYSTGDIVLYNKLKVWKSLQDNNTGNVPSENAFWTERPISPADGITDTPWAAGVFTYENSKVLDGTDVYYLQVPAPFESSDLAAEIINGDWA